ncbi:MAG: ACT domain-containing protein [Kiritimatiellae bacterium]|nr:ACT domain-containing protein [Kiritimatiellia bacterium]
MKKVIITVVGKDCVGILAKLCTYLAKANANILDISQTVLGGYFNMMMIVDGSKCAKKFDALKADLEKIGAAIGQRVSCQKSEIFEKMHRV